jgi:hypothetical protein
VTGRVSRHLQSEPFPLISEPFSRSFAANLGSTKKPRGLPNPLKKRSFCVVPRLCARPPPGDAPRAHPNWPQLIENTPHSACQGTCRRLSFYRPPLGRTLPSGSPEGPGTWRWALSGGKRTPAAGIGRERFGRRFGGKNVSRAREDDAGGRGELGRNPSRFFRGASEDSELLPETESVAVIN